MKSRKARGFAQPSAFILGLGENGYGVLRSLAREGVRTTGFYGERREFGRFSKYCEAHYLPPSLEEEEVCRALIEQARHGGDKPVLFATSDYHALLLAKHREGLSKHFRFHWLDDRQLLQIVDKAEMYRVCREAGVLAPRTHVTRPHERPAELPEQASFPCLVKPNRSFGSPFPTGLKNFIAESSDELLAFYGAHPELKGTTICQEIIEGDDTNIFQCTALVGLRAGSETVFCARKLRQYRPGQGVMCFGRSEENAALSARSLRLLRRLRYRGLASLEFKYRPLDGRYYFIEMNPRLPWYSALFADADVNLPYLAYLDLIGKPEPKAYAVRQRNGVHWISLKLDLGWFLLMRGKRFRRLPRWLRSMAKARSYAWFDWRDPKPFLRATLDLASARNRASFRALREHRTSEGSGCARSDVIASKRRARDGGGPQAVSARPGAVQGSGPLTHAEEGTPIASRATRYSGDRCGRGRDAME